MGKKFRRMYKKEEKMNENSGRKGHYREVIILNKKGKAKLDRAAKQIDSAVLVELPTNKELNDILRVHGLTVEDILREM